MSKLEDILPALREGRKAKMPLWKTYEKMSHILQNTAYDCVISDKWELEPKTVTVSREQVVKAFEKTLQYTYNSKIIDSVCKELGLGDE